MVIECFLDWVETAPVSKRTDASRALVKAWLRPDLDPEEREDVEAAMTTLLDDPAPGVRLALAVAFGAWNSAPRHIMSALAADNPEIATVVLSQSPVFMDAELVDFIRKGEVEHQIAIACRPWLGPAVVTAICQNGVLESCLGLLMNSASRFSQGDLHEIALRFGQHADIRLILTERTDIAPETRMMLIEKLGAALSGFVSKREWMPKGRLENVVSEACDKATINYAATAADDDVLRIARNLVDESRLNASFLLRAVCMGNISLVAASLSTLSGVSLSRVENVLTKDRRAAFRAIYDRAGMPASAFNVFQCAISTWRRLLLSGSPVNQSRLPFLVTREVLDTYSSGSDEIVDELLVLLRKLASQTARESAEFKAIEIAGRSKQPAKTLLLEAPEQIAEDVSDGDVVCDIFDEELFNIHFTDELARIDNLEMQPADLMALTGAGNSSDTGNGNTRPIPEVSEIVLTTQMANAA